MRGELPRLMAQLREAHGQFDEVTLDPAVRILQLLPPELDPEHCNDEDHLVLVPPGDTAIEAALARIHELRRAEAQRT